MKSAVKHTCSNGVPYTIHNLFTLFEVLRVVQTSLDTSYGLPGGRIDTKLPFQFLEFLLLSFSCSFLPLRLALDVLSKPSRTKSVYNGMDSMRHDAHFLASFTVLSRLPLRSRQESLLLVFWLLMRPPAARNCDPKPPFPPYNRGLIRRETKEFSSARDDRGVVGGSGRPESELRNRSFQFNCGYRAHISSGISLSSVSSERLSETVGNG